MTRIDVMQLNFKIDKLTHSLEDALTGKVFPTETLPFVKADLKTVTKQNGWKFNWNIEFSDTNKQVFKLVLREQPNTIQGLICLQMMSDHVFMPLIESAPHNFGKKKKYFGILGNLVAFGCKLAFEKGFDGCMVFISKTKLIEHYKKKLGAKVMGGQKMSIETIAAFNLVNRYYPEFFNKKFNK